MALDDLSTPTDIGSGVVIAKTSGEIVTVASGAQTIAVLTDDAGSNIVNVTTPADNVASPYALATLGFLMGYDQSANKFNRIRVNKSGQGALVVASSGQDYILAKAGIESGHVSIQSGMISIQSGKISVSSGTVHVMSGQLISKVSGEVLKVQAPSAILAGYTVIGAQSGGTALSSGAVVHVAIKSVSRSGDMWTGPPGVLSGAGYLLEQFDEIPYDIDNLNKIYVISEISGVRASWTAEVE